MDYVGQQDCEKYYYILTLIFGVLSWVCGWWFQEFRLTVNGWLIGSVFAAVISIPDWPMYNRNPIKWADQFEAERKEKAVATSKKGKAGGK